jgi:hypothetical protein
LQWKRLGTIKPAFCAYSKTEPDVQPESFIKAPKINFARFSGVHGNNLSQIKFEGCLFCIIFV